MLYGALFSGPGKQTVWNTPKGKVCQASIPFNQETEKHGKGTEREESVPAYKRSAHCPPSFADSSPQQYLSSVHIEHHEAKKAFPFLRFCNVHFVPVTSTASP